MPLLAAFVVGYFELCYLRSLLAVAAGVTNKHWDASDLASLPEAEEVKKRAA
jgi:hypothetical protein